VVDGYGHVSVRHPADPQRYLMSRSIAPELVTAADIMEYDLASAAADARGRTSYLERFIHGEIYRARPDVKAIVHNHSPSVIPFGVSTAPLRPLYHMSAFLGGGVPVFDIKAVAGGPTDMLVRNATLGQALAKTLGARPVALMRGHGAVVVADTIPNVVGRTIYLDLNARIQLQAIQLFEYAKHGTPITPISPEEAEKYAATDNYSRAWELWKKKAK
jgi:HCOMODA/2-hydroxy-3-carboxy-muconic semialdehyde decarboxylase